MNLLHMHCGESIAVRLQELTDAINRISEHTPNSPKANVIITAIICGVIGIVASLLIIKYFNRIHPKSNETSKGNQENSKQEANEVKAEYRSKILDFIEQEMISFKKIHELYASRRKEEKAMMEKINTNLEELKILYDYSEDNEKVCESKIAGIVESINNLNTTIQNDNAELKDSLMKIGEEEDFASNPYITTILGFLTKLGEEYKSTELFPFRYPITSKQNHDKTS